MAAIFSGQNKYFLPELKRPEQTLFHICSFASKLLLNDFNCIYSVDRFVMLSVKCYCHSPHCDE